ncbi:MAG: hypothetical protein MI923_11155, partial [Phycisphaerales bacterium]|nr:hypothetical protein [Phycisphaerales bacterium]
AGFPLFSFFKDELEARKSLKAFFYSQNYECLWSQESSVKYRWFSWPTIFTLAQTMEFRHRTKDLRSQDCDQ